MARTEGGTLSLEALATLLRRAERRIDERLRDVLAPLDLTPRGHGLLAALTETAMSQQQASQALGIDRTSMVALVDSLESASLVVRERHPSDRRAYTLVLTPLGEKRRKQAAKAISQVEEEIVGGLDEKELRRLGRTLRTLTEGEE